MPVNTSILTRPLMGFAMLYALSGLLATIIPAVQYRRGVQRSYRNTYYNNGNGQYQYGNQYQSYDAGREWRDINNCKVRLSMERLAPNITNEI